MAKESTSQRDNLHPLLYLGLPILSLVVIWLSPFLGYDRWEPLIAKEFGFLETGTVVFLLPAVVLGVMLSIRFFRNRTLRRRTSVILSIVMLLAAFAALYFAGEEISWGQTYLGFSTPEGWAEINEQKEFNLHNLKLERYGLVADLADDLLSNIPRQLMLWGTIVGGIVLPLTLEPKLSKPPAARGIWYWLIPNWRIVPISLLAAMSTVPEKILRNMMRIKFQPDDYVNMAFVDGAGEFKEYCFAMVILFYILSVNYRLRSKATTA